MKILSNYDKCISSSEFRIQGGYGDGMNLCNFKHLLYFHNFLCKKNWHRTKGTTPCVVHLSNVYCAMAVLYILQYRSFWHRSDVYLVFQSMLFFSINFFSSIFFCFQAKSQCTKKNWCEKSRAELTRVCVVYTSSLMREMCNSNVFILKVNRSPSNQSPYNLLYYCCRCCCRCLFETWCAELGFWYMEKVIDEQ